MSTPKEIRLQAERLLAKRSSRITHLQDGEKSGHFIQFHDKQFSDNDADDAVYLPEPAEDDDGSGFVPGQSGEASPAESVPTGVVKTGDDVIPKARVNTSADGTTEPPHVVNSDNRNVQKPITIDIAQLNRMSEKDREIMLHWVAKYPQRFVLGSTKATSVSTLDKKETPENKQVFVMPPIPLSGPDILQLHAK